MGAAASSADDLKHGRAGPPFRSHHDSPLRGFRHEPLNRCHLTCGNDDLQVIRGALSLACRFDEDVGEPLLVASVTGRVRSGALMVSTAAGAGCVSGSNQNT